MKGIYIHIPFCKHICNYCDFPKRIAKNEEQVNNYIDALINEINKYKEEINDEYKTIYIGGGTPNSLNIYNLEKILKEVDSLNILPKEYTIEINPDLLTLEQIHLFKRYGVNRISIGVQTFNKKGLELLGRSHSEEEISNAINLLKKNDFNNINIDLIFGYYGQTIDDVKSDLDKYLKLNIPHISYYSLILEEKTKLYVDYKNGLYKEIDEDLAADMYNLIVDTLISHGYSHYEISNFAKKGYESRHNLLYWNCEEYIGLGAGASGYLNATRYTNDHNINKYIYSNILYYEKLTDDSKKSEFMMLGLRKINGVSLAEYKKQFCSNYFVDFNIQKYIDYKLLTFDGDNLKFTRKGLLLGNQVFEEFV